MNMQSGMVVVLENGFNSSMDFMKEIQKKGIANNLKGWWWSSDKGLIRDPEESDEMVVKAQTMYDAMMGKPVYVNGVRMFQTHSPGEIRNMIDVCQHDILRLEEPQLGKPEQPTEVEFPPLTETVGSDPKDLFSFDNKAQHSTTLELNSGKTIIVKPESIEDRGEKLDYGDIIERCGDRFAKRDLALRQKHKGKYDHTYTVVIVLVLLVIALFSCTHK